MKNDFIVYAFHVPGSTEPFYVGKGHPGRPWEHFWKSKLEKCQTLFFKKLRALREKGIAPEIKIIVQGLTEDQAFELEKTLIKIWGRIDNHTGCLTNHTDGGEGTAGCLNGGHLHTIDDLVKMSKSKTGQALENLRQGRRKHDLVPVESYDLKTKVPVKQYACTRDVQKDGYNDNHVRSVIKGTRWHHKYLGWRKVTPEAIKSCTAQP